MKTRQRFRHKYLAARKNNYYARSVTPGLGSLSHLEVVTLVPALEFGIVHIKITAHAGTFKVGKRYELPISEVTIKLQDGEEDDDTGNPTR